MIFGIDPSTLVIIIGAGIAILFVWFYFTKTKKTITIDKMKIVSSNLVRSNRFNRAGNPVSWVVRNGKILFKINALSYLTYPTNIQGNRSGKMNVFMINVIPTLDLPILHTIENPFQKVFTLVISDKYLALNEARKQLLLLKDCTLFNFEEIIYNPADLLAFNFINGYSHLLNMHMIDSVLYAQAQRGTVVETGSVAEEKGKKESTEVDLDKIYQTAGKIG